MRRRSARSTAHMLLSVYYLASIGSGLLTLKTIIYNNYFHKTANDLKRWLVPPKYLFTSLAIKTASIFGAKSNKIWWWKESQLQFEIDSLKTVKFTFSFLLKDTVNSWNGSDKICTVVIAGNTTGCPGIPVRWHWQWLMYKDSQFSKSAEWILYPPPPNWLNLFSEG